MRWFVLLLATACAEERGRPDAGSVGRIHPPGILDEASDDFHGRELARRGYDLGVCATCHGADFAGGAARASCLDCHDDGPTACATCHRESNEAGAHPIHRTRDVGCAECHVVPTSWDAEGHVLRDGKPDPRPAEIAFGARANATIHPADRAGPAELVGDTCRNVYCHGDALSSAGGSTTEPRWVATVETGCGRCHGAPPPDHAQDECRTCHAAAAPHIDGVVDVGSGCDGCHGRGGDPAPPRDLGGNELTTALGVGAHQAHLRGLSGLRAPLACSECHAVPATLTAAGHIDSALPAEVLGAVAWDRISQTCGTWCHGTARPIWTEQAAAACGSCHGVPPATVSHNGVSNVQQCAACHPTGMPEHMDGEVDAF